MCGIWDQAAGATARAVPRERRGQINGLAERACAFFLAMCVAHGVSCAGAGCVRMCGSGAPVVLGVRGRCGGVRVGVWARWAWGVGLLIDVIDVIDGGSW